MSQSLRKPISCSSCRYSVIDTFASLAGLSVRSPSIIHSRPHFNTDGSRQRRPISTSQWRQSDIPNPPPEQSAEGATSHTPPLMTSVPWYLQVPAPTPSSAPSPQAFQPPDPELPALPENPPPMLSAMLNHLYTNLGLSQLALLDLRHLNPPPALGANLIMIVGTARSVKHLNVSADRFCRWCRAQYKLRPYADGLLGRNELKLKLRRRARRQKLLGAAGASESSRSLGSDDGITTGWVCVNVGEVDATGQQALDEDSQSLGETSIEDDEEEEEYENPEDDGYIGFGSQSNAPRIVVQMFTEEKRAEMDLEGLWNTRQGRRAKKDDEAIAAVEDDLRGRQETRAERKVDTLQLGAGFVESRPRTMVTAN